MRTQAMIATTLIVAALASLDAWADARSTQLRVAYGDVPGATALDEGDPQEAIRVLEARAHTPGTALLDDELATLCAAYILAGRLDEAAPACDRAVDEEHTTAAFNNRGVLRAYTGDFDGAQYDFAKVRVPASEVDEFTELLTAQDPRLMATHNLEEIRRLRPAHGLASPRVSRHAPRGASIERIGQ